MKKIFTCLLATLGLTTACGQQNFENVDVQGFSELIENPSVVLLDVRTASEFAEGHIEGAVNIDQGQSNFIETVRTSIATGKKIAVYCRSGRRSANAAERLAAEGYQCVNLKGGIIAWKEAGKAVTTDTYEVDVFKTKSGKTVKFHALVHASIRMEYDGKEIEIDPVTKLGNRTIDLAAMPKANYIFVTHEHGDHFDKEAIKLLSDAGTRLVTNKRCADMLGYGETMANGDRIQISDDFTVEAVPAYNITEGRTQFHPQGRDNGYILTIDGLRIYIAGDTEDIPEMNNVKDIDIAFLPCNQPYTMTTEQLVKAAKTIRPKVLFPYHYGQTDLTTVPSQLQGDGIDVRIRHYE
jgi:L-ascorbate metabolism protein UlaG (beta-lactamase superfamily)/rhodanese-related sulfurtransferase